MLFSLSHSRMETKKNKTRSFGAHALENKSESSLTRHRDISVFLTAVASFSLPGEAVIALERKKELRRWKLMARRRNESETRECGASL